MADEGVIAETIAIDGDKNKRISLGGQLASPKRRLRWA
jgi:hypothetical protein